MTFRIYLLNEMRMTVMWHKFEMASEKAREKGKNQSFCFLSVGTRYYIFSMNTEMSARKKEKYRLKKTLLIKRDDFFYR